MGVLGQHLKLISLLLLGVAFLGFFGCSNPFEMISEQQSSKQPTGLTDSRPDPWFQKAKVRTDQPDSNGWVAVFGLSGAVQNMLPGDRVRVESIGFFGTADERIAEYEVALDGSFNAINTRKSVRLGSGRLRFTILRNQRIMDSLERQIEMFYAQTGNTTALLGSTTENILWAATFDEGSSLATIHSCSIKTSEYLSDWLIYPNFFGTCDHIYLHHRVTSMVEAASKRLFAATDGGGLVSVDYSKTRPIVSTLTGVSGISFSKIRRIIQTPDGALWLLVSDTGSTGLVRILTTESGDISHIQALGPAEGIVSNQIENVVQGRDGSIWVATRGTSDIGGLVQLRFSGETLAYENYGKNIGLLSNSFRDVVAASNGEVWVVTDKPELARLRISSTVNVLVFRESGTCTGASIPCKGLASLYIDILKISELSSRTDGTFQGLAIASPYAAVRIRPLGEDRYDLVLLNSNFYPETRQQLTTLKQDKTHRLWITGPRGMGFFRYPENDYPFSYYHHNPLFQQAQDEFSYYPFTEMAETLDGLIWLGGRKGIYIYTGATGVKPYERYALGATISGNKKFIYESKNGSIWSGTDDGINQIINKSSGRPVTMTYVYDGNSVLKKSDRDFLWEFPIPENKTRGIVETPNESIWVVAEKALYEFPYMMVEDMSAGGQYSDPIIHLFSGTNESLVAATVTEYGSLLLLATGTSTGSIKRFENGAFVDLISDGYFAAATAFIESADRSIWVATNKSLLQVKQAANGSYEIVQLAPLSLIFKLMKTPGGLLAVSPESVFQIGSQNQIKELMNVKSLDLGRLLSVASSSSGSFWFGTTTGIKHLSFEKQDQTIAENVSALNQVLPFPNGISHILEDRSGRLWLTANDLLGVY